MKIARLKNPVHQNKTKKNAAVSSRVLLFHGFKAVSCQAQCTGYLDFEIGNG